MLAVMIIAVPLVFIAYLFYVETQATRRIKEHKRASQERAKTMREWKKGDKW